MPRFPDRLPVAPEQAGSPSVPTYGEKGFSDLQSWTLFFANKNFTLTITNCHYYCVKFKLP